METLFETKIETVTSAFEALASGAERFDATLLIGQGGEDKFHLGRNGQAAEITRVFPCGFEVCNHGGCQGSAIDVLFLSTSPLADAEACFREIREALGI